MTIQCTFTEMSGFLLIEVKGDWTTAAAKKVLDEARREADARGLKHLLVDMRSMQTPRDEFTRFESGNYLAQVFQSPFKVAAVANPENINRFAENVAVNRGADLRVFSDKHEAVEWLVDQRDSI